MKWQLLRKSGDAIILNTVFCSVGDIIECIIVPSTARIETAWEGFSSRVDKCPDSRDMRNEKHPSRGENIPPCGQRLGTKFSLDVTTHPGQWGQVAGADSVFWLTSANDKPRSSLRAGKPFPAAEAGHYAGVWYWELWRLSIVITGGHICNPRTRGRTVSPSQSEARVSDHWPMRGRVRVTPAGARTPGITTGLQSQVGIIRGCNNKDTMRVLLKHFASIIN